MPNCTTRLKWQTASANGDCLEWAIDQACGNVHVRNSRFRSRVELMPIQAWTASILAAQAVRSVQRRRFFAGRCYDLAVTLTRDEWSVFRRAVLAGDPRVTAR